MELLYAPTSPYARKARITVIEKELENCVSQTQINPFGDELRLQKTNPLGKVPALVLDSGDVILDSTVICAYLDACTKNNPLMPEVGQPWQARTAEAMAHGIMDAAFSTVMELRRPPAQQSEMWLDRWRGAIRRALSAVNRDTDTLNGGISIAQIALASALGYLDFRLPDFDWRHESPRLNEWFGDFRNRPSMLATNPEN